MLKLFSGVSLQALLVSGLIGAVMTGLVAGWPVASIAYRNGVGSQVKRHVQVEDRFFNREAVLWYELGAARQSQIIMAANFEAVIDGTDEARAKAKRAYQQEKQRAEQAVSWVADALRELDRVQNEWKGKPVPADVILPFCVRLGQDSCQAAPSQAGGFADVAIRGANAGDVHTDAVSGAGGTLPAGAGGAPDE